MENKLKKQFAEAKRQKQQWNETYRGPARLSMPERSDFYEEHTAGERKVDGNEIYDSIGLTSLDKFVSNVQSSLIPPQKVWAMLKAGLATDGNLAFMATLQELNHLVFSKIHNSNFDIQATEFLQDLALGTGAVLIMPDVKRKGVTFKALPLTQLYLSEGEQGEVGTVFRCFEMPLTSVEETWPDADIDRETREMMGSKKIKLVEVIRKAEITVPKRGEKGTETVDGYKYEVYKSCFGKKFVERDSRTSPIIVTRFSKSPGEVYGRGPLLRAYPDLRTINKTKELVLKNASLAVAGAYTVADDGIVNISNIRITPGAIIPVGSNEGSVQGPTIAPLARAGDFDVAQIVLSDLRRSINETMFADPLGPIDLPVKTATEVSIRQQELSKRIGSAFGRLQYEFLNPLIKRVIDILETLGVIDVSDLEIDGQIADIEYSSPLALAENEEKSMKMVQALGVVRDLFGQEALLMTTDIKKAIENVFTLSGVELEVLNDDAKLQQLMQIMTQLAEQRLTGGGQQQQAPNE